MKQNDQWQDVIEDPNTLWAVVHGDCIATMRGMPDNCLDSVVTDPPYDLTSNKKGGSGTASLNPNSPAGRARIGTGGGGFMGKTWDATGIAFDPETWKEVLRVLKPGGHLLAFGGTRTYHRMTCAIEDAGFEIRDSVHFTYGTGFPKSMNIQGIMNKAARGCPQGTSDPDSPNHGKYKTGCSKENPSGRGFGAGAGSFMAEQGKARGDDEGPWQGFGTAIKPAHEPIVVARKPFSGTVAANVLKYGTGGLNIDGCRVQTADNLNGGCYSGGNRPTSAMGNVGEAGGKSSVFEAGTERLSPEDFKQPIGRFPPNVLLAHSPGCVRIGTETVTSSAHYPSSRGPGGISTSGHSGQVDLLEVSQKTETVSTWKCAEGCPVALMDEQSGKSKSSGGRMMNISKTSTIYGGGKGLGQADVSPEEARGDPGFGDTGGASRFFPTFEWQETDFPPFKYCAKASVAERERGCEKLPKHTGADCVDREEGSAGMNSPRAGSGRTSEGRANYHATVKPVTLLRWLVRLVTPPGGIVFDPFTGSGTTGVASLQEGFRFLGTEQDEGYTAIARARVGNEDPEAAKEPDDILTLERSPEVLRTPQETLDWWNE